jgi:hypothetical protein
MFVIFIVIFHSIRYVQNLYNVSMCQHIAGSNPPTHTIPSGRIRWQVFQKKINTSLTDSHAILTQESNISKGFKP